MVFNLEGVQVGRDVRNAGFLYQMYYMEPRLIRNALGEKTRSLPFVRSAVLRNQCLMAALRPALDDLDRDLEALETDQVVLAIAEALLALDAFSKNRSLAATCSTAVELARQFLDAHFERVVASEV